MPGRSSFPPRNDIPGGCVARTRGRRGFLPLALASLLVAQAGCQQPPSADLAGARASLDKARRGGAPVYAAEELKQAEEALRRAERSVILQSARISFRRDYREAAFLTDRAKFLSVQALRLSRGRRVQAREEAEGEIGDLQKSLARAREIKRFLSPREPSVVRLLVGASVDLEVAEKRMKAEDFPGAIKSARSGTKRVREVEQVLLSSIVRYTAHPDLASWRRWVDQAVRWSRSERAVAFVVDKLRRRMTVYRSGRRTRTYSVDLGLGGMDRKLRSGDDATPEGLYKIEEIRGLGQTRYYRAFLLDYPNAQDRRRFEQARRSGRIPRGSDPGSLIEIHGEGGRDLDWTRGCVALTNPEMDELARIVRVGTPVAIVGYNPRDQEDLW